ncbi:MAG: ABC transporter ATP-binding protein [Planctomycetota bacterium]|jgi:multiple sugar transport system ATP-binding protein
MAEIELTNVKKTFPDGTEAVHDFSLLVADGELVVLVGPSGCGKSTTLRLIAGLEELTAGEIRIGDRTVNNLHPKHRDIAMVFQNYALYPHMTVSQNLGFALRMRKTRKEEIRRRVAQVAVTLGIEDLLDRRPKALSGGQQQRVALGRAMIREPAAFLFDEPLSNLDAKLRVEMRAEIKSLQRRSGTTTIHVTHDQEEAMTLGDRVVVMCDGRIQQIGAPLDVYRRPANRFVASFIGMPAMNLIDGRVERRDGGLQFIEDANGRDESPGNRLDLAAAWSERLAAHVDQPVVLGVRPGSFLGLDRNGDRSAPGVEIEIEVVEMLGDTIGLVGATPTRTPVVARIATTDQVPDAGPARLQVDPDRLHFFEPGRFGRNLAAAK